MSNEEKCVIKVEGEEEAEEQSRSNRLYDLDPLATKMQTPMRTVREFDFALVCTDMQPFLALHLLDRIAELWECVE